MGYTYGTKWTEELVEKSIMEVVKSLNIDHMPSSKECIQVFKNSSLSNKIARTGGFKYWADKMNLGIKESETKKGKSFEEIARIMLIQQGFKVEKMDMKHPYDLLVNENIRIDVKAGVAYNLDGSRVHTIGIIKKNATCDLYLIFALDEKMGIERVMIIPGNKLKLITLTFGKTSKYSKYENRWDLIKFYDSFYSKLDTEIEKGI